MSLVGATRAAFVCAPRPFVPNARRQARLERLTDAREIAELHGRHDHDLVIDVLLGMAGAESTVAVTQGEHTISRTAVYRTRTYGGGGGDARLPLSRSQHSPAAASNGQGRRSVFRASSISAHVQKGNINQEEQETITQPLRLHPAMLKADLNGLDGQFLRHNFAGPFGGKGPRAREGEMLRAGG